MTINFKLHANILSLAAGVPCVALVYRFKVFDLASSSKLEKCVVSTNSSNFEQNILMKIAYIEENESSIIKKYKNSEALYRPMLTEPFIKKLI
ncbi:hypothetical protein M8R20_21420 [Pseudomonas sp. R2.Fl]|nr:hypothetical protein [Pseudomonas sp. R2.Fl]